MTSERVRLVAEALYWRKGYADSNPDVGFGPFIDTLLEEVCKGARVSLTVDEKKEVLKRVQQMRHQPPIL